MLFGDGVSCPTSILYSIFSYLYVSGGGSITSVGGEIANLSAIVYLSIIMWFLFGGVPLPFGACGGLCYFNVALPGPSI